MFSLQWNTSADRTGHRSHGGSLLFCILLQPYVFSCCCYHPQIFFLRKDWNRLNHLPLSINSKNPYITLPCSLEESFKAKSLQTFALVSFFFMFGLILFLGGDFFSNTEFFSVGTYIGSSATCRSRTSPLFLDQNFRHCTVQYSTVQYSTGIKYRYTIQRKYRVQFRLRDFSRMLYYYCTVRYSPTCLSAPPHQQQLILIHFLKTKKFENENIHKFKLKPLQCSILWDLLAVCHIYGS